MKVTLQPTSKVLELRSANGIVPARIWEGETDKGVKVHAFITRIAIGVDEPPDVVEEFQKCLKEEAAPSVEVAAYPLRLVL